MTRTCSKPTCSRAAQFTLTYDYDGCVAAIGPLSPWPTPTGTDLCVEHADRFTVPDGWSLVRHVESTGEF